MNGIAMLSRVADDDGWMDGDACASPEMLRAGKGTSRAGGRRLIGTERRILLAGGETQRPAGRPGGEDLCCPLFGLASFGLEVRIN